MVLFSQCRDWVEGLLSLQELTNNDIVHVYAHFISLAHFNTADTRYYSGIRSILL
jgi:hypothetical protein